MKIRKKDDTEPSFEELRASSSRIDAAIDVYNNATDLSLAEDRQAALAIIKDMGDSGHINIRSAKNDRTRFFVEVDLEGWDVRQVATLLQNSGAENVEATWIENDNPADIPDGVKLSAGTNMVREVLSTLAKSQKLDIALGR